MFFLSIEYVSIVQISPLDPALSKKNTPTTITTFLPSYRSQPNFKKVKAGCLVYAKKRVRVHGEGLTLRDQNRVSILPKG
jgi:hypothetical protein